MLASAFKTPAELKLDDVEFLALVKVLGMLERGEVRHAPAGDALDAPKGKYAGLFNMEDLYTKARCGTAACMAGTCDWLFGTKFQGRFWSGNFGDRFGDLSFELRELFAPQGTDDCNWNAITVEQAAIALRNYLTSGQARWSEVLELEPEVADAHQ